MNSLLYNCISNPLEAKKIRSFDQEMKQIIPQAAIDHTGDIKKIILKEFASVLL